VYHAQLGRFGSRDPIGYAAGVNVLEYVWDAPTNRIDPSGTQAFGWNCWELRSNDPETIRRREFQAGCAAFGVTIGLPAALSAPTVASSAFRLAAPALTTGAGVAGLTASQIQALINSSGGRVVPVFTRLAQSPAANRICYTSKNPRLCNQIQKCTERTQLYVGKIPLDLFNRLKVEGQIWTDQTQMGNVIDRAYVISPQAMAILRRFFEETSCK